jgi:hypothetical protein
MWNLLEAGSVQVLALVPSYLMLHYMLLFLFFFLLLFFIFLHYIRAVELRYKKTDSSLRLVCAVVRASSKAVTQNMSFCSLSKQVPEASLQPEISFKLLPARSAHQNKKQTRAV